MTLPPLSNASCAKCGAAPGMIALRYYSDRQPPPYGALARDRWSEYSEALERRCTLCQFTWLEAPKDANLDVWTP